MSHQTSEQVKLLYFSWVKEKVGHGQETVSLPEHVTTVAEVIDWLKTRGPEYESAFAEADVIRSAINQVHVKNSASIATANEIAFFPPVTGG